MKQYVKPNIETLCAEVAQTVAVSIVGGGIADGSEVLAKEHDAWDVWADGE